MSGFFVAAVMGFAAIILWPSLQYAHGETDCSGLGAGYRPAIASDAAVINGQIPTGTCYNPSTAIGINENAEAAKQFLRTRYQPGNCSAKNASPNDGIDKLDAQFAINLAAMLKRAPMVINLNSAYRSDAAQQCANPKVTASNHGRGCAVDLQYDQDSCDSAACQWVLQNAAQDKLQIRMRYAPEWNHLEPMACAGSNLGGPITRPMAGAGNYFPQQMQQMGALSRLFMPPQPQQCAAGSILLNGTCISQQAYNATQQTTNPFSYVSPPPPPPISSTLGTSGSANVNNNTNAGSSASKNNSSVSSVNVSDLIGSSGTGENSNSGNGSTTSAIDLINAIANPTTTDETVRPSATGTPVALVSGLNNTVALHGSSTALDPSWRASSTYSLSPAVSQTFVSQDLSKTPANLHQMQPANSTFAILENIKQVLIAVLAYLKPFGGAVPRTTTANNMATAYLE